jgi:hypothetical protein
MLAPHAPERVKRGDKRYAQRFLDAQARKTRHEEVRMNYVVRNILLTKERNGLVCKFFHERQQLFFRQLRGRTGRHINHTGPFETRDERQQGPVAPREHVHVVAFADKLTRDVRDIDILTAANTLPAMASGDACSLIRAIFTEVSSATGIFEAPRMDSAVCGTAGVLLRAFVVPVTVRTK